MNKLLLAICTICILCAGPLYAQNQEVICTMTVEDIQRDQPFDIDHYKSEFVSNIATDIFEELNLIYNMVNNNDTTDVAVHIENIHSSIEEADEIDMNYTMFEEDFEFIETLD
ncbi:MAG: hypothetical protein QNK23_02620 [Crocinitomicaceae bacterium]|nr:hypothetical protein [Crocinitomicaceae bacterium]